MVNNSTKILFLSILFIGVLISLCANSWVGAWMGLEINLLSLIPLLSSNKNMFSSEASLKYFLIQAIASSTLLFLILLKSNMQEMFYFMNMMNWNNLIILPLLMKIAASPFYWWLPSVMEGLSWMNCFILLSIQKIAPLMLISYMLMNNIFIQIVIISSAVIGAVGGMNQISLRKIISYSSINHIGWMLSAMIMGFNLWFLYFTIYLINIISIILLTNSNNLSYIPQTFNMMNNQKIMKFILFIAMLSLGGLPPFLGFYPKWIMLHFMTQNMMNFTSIILITTSLLTLYYYMRMMYTILMITNSENTWFVLINWKTDSLSKSMMFSMSLLVFGMMMCTLMLWMY
uniref:NADH-ubiquinone oxidoreductase chain 2 n=1 Tax=Pseudovates peruviana TaxID=2853947 RepID=A0A8F4PMJ6_9NEOP|nr:NADH dehydrogenase subunit 2 [Pseudovates peruviana]